MNDSIKLLRREPFLNGGVKDDIVYCVEGDILYVRCMCGELIVVPHMMIDWGGFHLGTLTHNAEGCGWSGEFQLKDWNFDKNANPFHQYEYVSFVDDSGSRYYGMTSMVLTEFVMVTLITQGETLLFHGQVQKENSRVFHWKQLTPSSLEEVRAAYLDKETP